MIEPNASGIVFPSPPLSWKLRIVVLQFPLYMKGLWCHVPRKCPVSYAFPYQTFSIYPCSAQSLFSTLLQSDECDLLDSIVASLSSGSQLGAREG